MSIQSTLLYVLYMYGTGLFLLALAENVTSLGPHVNCIHTFITHEIMK